MDWSTTDLLAIATTTRPNLAAMTEQELDALVSYVVGNSPHFRLVSAAQKMRAKLQATEDLTRATDNADAAVVALPEDFRPTR